MAADGVRPHTAKGPCSTLGEFCVVFGKGKLLD